jgi:hypothetical protein
MRALECCGYGFWEFDLVDGSAWFNDWFFRKLGWSDKSRRATLSDLQPLVQPEAWDELMRTCRDHLEKGQPLNLEMEVRVGDERERWRMRGCAHRNDTGQPVFLAGSMRDVTGESASPELSGLRCLCSAFDALPVAAALLDAHAAVLQANRLWREFPAGTATLAIARLRAANSQTAIEFWLDEGDAGPRRLRVRAIAFQHEGSLHMAVTLEDAVARPVAPEGPRGVDPSS